MAEGPKSLNGFGLYVTAAYEKPFKILRIIRNKEVAYNFLLTKKCYRGIK